MKTVRLCWFSISILILLLVSCKTDQMPPAQQFRIKRINYKKVDDFMHSLVFNYSASGRIDSITTGYVTDDKLSISGRKLFYYDRQGRLEKIERQFKAVTGMVIYKPGEYVADMRYNFYYDGKGNLSTIYAEQVSDYNKFARFYGEWDFDYADSSKVPSRVTSISSGPVSSGHAQYFYEHYGYVNGNVTQRETSPQPTAGKYTPEVYQYDDKPNLLKGVVYGCFYNRELVDLFDDLRAFSQNNVLLSHERYTYDANGLLVKAAQRDGAYEVTYEYETY